jgi:hypothetical protein
MNKHKLSMSEDDQINALEAHLAGVLKPVRPPGDVIHRLRERIHFPQPQELASHFRDWKKMFLVFGGVMSGLLVIVTVARALFYLVGRRHG